MTTYLRLNLVEEVFKILNHPDGARGRLRDVELEGGRTIIEPSPFLAFPYSLRDFDEDTLITRQLRDIRMVIVKARQPGSGAFGRLVRGIAASGFDPVVISPVGPIMPAIMAKWGWRNCPIGKGWKGEDQWRPA